MLPMSRNEEPIGSDCDVCGKSGTIILIPSWNGAVGDGIRMGLKKPDGGWHEVLSKIQQHHPAGNTGRWGKNSSTPLELFERKMGKRYSVGADSRDSSLNIHKKD